MVVSHDFTWSDEDMANMIRCFDSNGDGKVLLSFKSFVFFGLKKYLIRFNIEQIMGDWCY